MTDTSRIADLRFQVSEKMPINHSDLSGLFDHIEALEAENERLRGALGDLIEAVQRRTADLGGYDGRFGLNKSIAKARAALGKRQ